jgi:hypothetical protein
LEEPGATIVVFAKLRMLVQDHIPSLLRIRVLDKELVKLQHIARKILVRGSRFMECLPQFIKRAEGLKLLILKDTDTFWYKYQFPFRAIQRRRALKCGLLLLNDCLKQKGAASHALWVTFVLEGLRFELLLLFDTISLFYFLLLFECNPFLTLIINALNALRTLSFRLQHFDILRLA